MIQKRRKSNRLLKLVTLLIDILLICVSFFAAAKLVLTNEIFLQQRFIYLNLLPVIIVIEILLFITNGLYSVEHKRYAQVFTEIAVSLLATIVIITGLSFLVNQLTYSRWVILAGIGINFVLSAVWRRFSWRYDRARQKVRDVMILGNKEECEHTYRRIMEHPLLDFNIKYVSTDVENIEWEGFVRKVDEVILCPNLPLKIKSEIARFAIKCGVQPILMPKTYDMIFRGMELDQIDDIPVFRPRELRLSLDQRSLKRVMDIIVAGLAGICFLPFMVLVAFAIKVKDPGPVIYSQLRVGRDNKEFRIYKFRTMKVDAEKYTGPVIAGEDDPRITPLGRFLRKVRLDELPQLWNVLKGDMSVVGPRPERKFFCDQFAAKMPLYPERHNVKPGITGLAQVRGKYNTTAHDKLVFDLMYIQHYSLMNDIAIMVQTVKVMCTKSATEGVDYDSDAVNLEALEAHNYLEEK